MHPSPSPSISFDPSELNQLCGLRVLELDPSTFGGPDTPADFNDALNDPEALDEALEDSILDIQQEMDELELQRLRDEEEGEDIDDDDEMMNDDEEDDLPYEDFFTDAGDMYNDDRDE